MQEGHADTVAAGRAGVAGAPWWRWNELLKAVAGACLALLAMEVVVRQVYAVRFAFEPGAGYIRRTVHYRLEGNGLSHWTTFDLRRRQPADPTLPSIVVLGDSFTEALMVGDDEVFTSRLEAGLRRSGLEFQVLNFGYSGTSAADYAAYASFYRQSFSPRWTIVELRDEDLTTDAWSPGKPHFRRSRPGGDLETVAGPMHFEEVRDNRWKQRLRAVPSMLLYHGLGRIGEFQEGFFAEPPLFRAGSAEGAHRAGAADGEANYPIEEALDLMARRYDQRVTFLFLARYDPENPLGAGSTQVEQRFDQHCAGAGLSCVNLRSAFPEFARLRQSPYGFPNTGYNAGHINADGHRAAATTLLPALLRLNALGLL